ncbi:hypothetical protein B0I35DRAFT_463158 [Stachybotrys elegans]|uniref:Uncharacterized protein n=1 Tax=Stachybotrys elegans TaxID=80388 RepID=A0A8K0WP24_9HYPO|nr:hypothetical protein B0I35DRAFT_463158 [Stachybotrys elegans]
MTSCIPHSSTDKNLPRERSVHRFMGWGNLCQGDLGAATGHWALAWLASLPQPSHHTLPANGACQRRNNSAHTPGASEPQAQQSLRNACELQIKAQMNVYSRQGEKERVEISWKMEEGNKRRKKRALLITGTTEYDDSPERQRVLWPYAALPQSKETDSTLWEREEGPHGAPYSLDGDRWTWL